MFLRTIGNGIASSFKLLSIKQFPLFEYSYKKAGYLRQELSHDKRVEFLEWSAEFDMKYEKVFSFIDIEKEKMEQWGV